MVLKMELRDLYPQIEALAPTIIRVILHEKNLGKGGALQTGFRWRRGILLLSKMLIWSMTPAITPP